MRATGRKTETYIPFTGKAFKQGKSVVVVVQIVENSKPNPRSKLVGDVSGLATSNELI